MAATTMNISLTPELRATIEKRVKSGLYGNDGGLGGVCRQNSGHSRLSEPLG